MGMQIKSLSLSSLFGKKEKSEYPVWGKEAIMAKKVHGSSVMPVQDNLRWGVNRGKADEICNFNRRAAEPSGYFVRRSISFMDELKSLQQQQRLVDGSKFMTFYDSNTGKPLFRVPSSDLGSFFHESKVHGWPSFRDEHVDWKHVRCIRKRKQEIVSIDGTHLGHNLPDARGNRYCINLSCIAGRPRNDGIIYYIDHNDDDE